MIQRNSDKIPLWIIALNKENNLDEPTAVRKVAVIKERETSENFELVYDKSCTEFKLENFNG